jgi:hypothetical protein
MIRSQFCSGTCPGGYLATERNNYLKNVRKKRQWRQTLFLPALGHNRCLTNSSLYVSRNSCK